ncbi:MAG: benzoate-CoA ligase family protein [Chloroflexi bacterium]|nr:benzoate-CoA ligase family protein [Chloroflexota bacterium]OJV94667.1 MAG: 4-hydroxybenzoate--CoA ligase [Chloroflexi bacterium 54-19]
MSQTGPATANAATSLVNVPSLFNAATYFVDRNLAEGRANKTAIYYENQEITYGQVGEMVNRTGNALTGLGLQIEQRVLLLLLDCPQYPAAFFGTMKIGAVPIPTNTLMKPADYRYFLNDSRAVFAIVSEQLLPALEPIRENCPQLRQVIVVSQQPGGPNDTVLKAKGYLLFHELLENASPELDAFPTSRDDAAFWLYSSGTTGFPKGAVHLHRDMVYCTEYYARGILKMTGDDRCFSVAKLFFAYGLGNGLYFPFGVGASTILHPGRPEPGKLLEIASNKKPTLFFGVPTAFASMLSQPGNYDLGSVRAGVSAGEALPKAVWERFKARFGVEILDGIGSTEVLHIFVSNRPGEVRPGSTGKVVPGYEARIVDENGQDVGPNEEGMLIIKGPSTCAYYWNKWDKTRETILGEWIRTGDKYHEDEDGYYWYHGRADDMIKAGGIWVSPVEVENALVEHPAVQETGVVGRMDGDELVKPCAFVVVKADYAAGPALEQELKQFVKDKIAVYKYPRWIIFVESLPRTATGKLQRFKLRELQ